MTRTRHALPLSVPSPTWPPLPDLDHLGDVNEMILNALAAVETGYTAISRSRN